MHVHDDVQIHYPLGCARYSLRTTCGSLVLIAWGGRSYEANGLTVHASTINCIISLILLLRARILLFCARFSISGVGADAPVQQRGRCTRALPC